MVGLGGPSADEVAERERIEIELWRTPGYDCSASNWIENFVDQAGDAEVFWEKLGEYRDHFESSGRIVEVGAGQCWASCILKKLWPEKMIYATDIAPGALSASRLWQHIFCVELDGACSCRSYFLPFGSETIDLVFCFQAAHHFGYALEALAEMHRILRNGGTALYLHEPSSRRWSRSMAQRRLTVKRPNVPEDVLIYPEIVQMAAQVGFETNVNFVPTTTNKDFAGTIYFHLLKKGLLPRTILPCIVDVVLTKKK